VGSIGAYVSREEGELEATEERAVAGGYQPWSV